MERIRRPSMNVVIRRGLGEAVVARAPIHSIPREASESTIKSNWLLV